MPRNLSFEKHGFREDYKLFKESYGDSFLATGAAAYNSFRLNFFPERVFNATKKYDEKYGRTIDNINDQEELYSILQKAERTLFVSYLITFSAVAAAWATVLKADQLEEIIIGMGYSVVSASIGRHLNWKSEVQIDHAEDRLEEIVKK